MKKCILVVISLLYSFLCANMVFAGATCQKSNSGNTWTQKADFGGTGRIDAVGFSIGSNGYIGTGSGTSAGYLKDFWKYDPATNKWTQKADFGGIGRYGAFGFSIIGSNVGYIGTGWTFEGGNVSYSKDFWEYNPATNIWTQKADFGGGGRTVAVGFSIGSKGYAGIGNGYVTNDFWEYDPATNTWTQKSDVYVGNLWRYSAVGFSIGSKGYIGTGANPFEIFKDFWEYDPTTDTWTQKADFGGGGRGVAVGFSIGSKGYIGTGSNGSSDLKDFWEYDPATNTWTQKADVGGVTGAARDSAVGFSIGSKGYIGTGSNGSSDLKDFWEYTPADTTPNQFIFAVHTGVALNTIVTSNTITVSGINTATPISIIGGTYSINGNSYTSASGTVNNCDRVTVQLTSSGNYSTTTNATLTIGGVSDTFSVTTIRKR